MSFFEVHRQRVGIAEPVEYVLSVLVWRSSQLVSEFAVKAQSEPVASQNDRDLVSLAVEGLHR